MFTVEIGRRNPPRHRAPVSGSRSQLSCYAGVRCVASALLLRAPPGGSACVTSCVSESGPGDRATFRFTTVNPKGPRSIKVEPEAG